MADREDCVYHAKLAEQAERYDGKSIVSANVDALAESSVYSVAACCSVLVICQ